MRKPTAITRGLCVEMSLHQSGREGVAREDAHTRCDACATTKESAS